MVIVEVTVLEKTVLYVFAARRERRPRHPTSRASFSLSAQTILCHSRRFRRELFSHFRRDVELLVPFLSRRRVQTLWWNRFQRLVLEWAILIHG